MGLLGFRPVVGYCGFCFHFFSAVLWGSCCFRVSFCVQDIMPSLRDVKFALGSHADTTHACNSLRTYACWQPCPQLHRIVYGPHVAARDARHWGLTRCGHHNFSNGRSARHRNQHTVPTHTPCRFCANASDSLADALRERTAHNVLRQRWQSRSRHADAVSLHILFSTSPDVNTARDIMNNIVMQLMPANMNLNVHTMHRAYGTQHV